MAGRPRYHAGDRSRDVLELDSRTILIDNARSWSRSPALEREGFALFAHRSEVADFGDPREISRTHIPEIEHLLLEQTGADEIVVSPAAVRRTTPCPAGSSRIKRSGSLYETRPVCFVHIDIDDTTASALAERRRPRAGGRCVWRFAHYNIWRALTPPPQDLPLALCDSRSVSPTDLVEADAIMDLPGMPESSYVGLLVRHNPRHSWSHFPDMNRDEVIVFKTHDSERDHPSHVPHAAFSDPTCPAAAEPRASIEMRAIAYWFRS